MKPFRRVARAVVRAGVVAPLTTLKADSTESRISSTRRWAGAVAAVTIFPGASYVGVSLFVNWISVVLFVCAATVGATVWLRRISAAGEGQATMTPRELITAVWAVTREHRDELPKPSISEKPTETYTTRSQIAVAALLLGSIALVLGTITALLSASALEALPADLQRVTQWHPLAAAGGYYSVLAVLSAAVVRHRRGVGSKADREVEAAAILRMPVSTFRAGGGHVRLVQGNVVVHLPAAARGRSKEDLESEVARIAPGLTVKTVDWDEMTLTPIGQGSPVLESRQLREAHDGLVTAVQVLPSQPARTAHARWTVTPIATPQQLALQARERGLALVEWRPHELHAYVAAVDPRVLSLRDRFADRIGCAPWEVELFVRGPNSMDQIVILRSPIDKREPEKRKAFWLGQAADLFPPSERFVWRYEEAAGVSMAALLLKPDRLADNVPWLEDPSTPVSPSDPWNIGVDEDGQAVHIDLAAGSHLLIAGATRSGKSVCSYSLLTHVARMGDRARLLVADPNDTTIAPFADVVSWWTNSVSPEPVTEMLRWVHREMERRREVLRQMRTDKVTEFTPDLPLLVVVIDEAAGYLAGSDTSAAKDLQAELQQIASQGAKFGVRLVLILQRPDTTVLKGAIRSQLSGRISFGLEDLETARMVFPDIDDPAVLLSVQPGVGMIKTVGSGPRRFRGAYLADHWAAADAIRTPMPKVDVTERIVKPAASSLTQSTDGEGEVRELTPVTFSFEDLDLQPPEPLAVEPAAPFTF